MKPIVLIILLLFASACKSNNNGGAPAEEVASANRTNKADISLSKISEPAPQEHGVTDTSKKLIKEGSISFETSDLKNTRSKILASLNKVNGYVAEEQENNNSDGYRKQITLNLRVPSKNFDQLLESISGDAEHIDSKNVSVKDVTSQFIDIKTSLNNQKLLENRYLELLKKADKMGDVLQIEAKLSEIRTTIDSTQGALNYLSKQVAYSTLEVTFYTRGTAQDNGNTMGYKLKTAIINGLDLLANLFFGLITLWPVIIVVVFLYIVIKRWRRRRKLRDLQKLTDKL